MASTRTKKNISNVSAFISGIVAVGSLCYMSYESGRGKSFQNPVVLISFAVFCASFVVLIVSALVSKYYSQQEQQEVLEKENAKWQEKNQRLQEQLTNIPEQQCQNVQQQFAVRKPEIQELENKENKEKKFEDWSQRNHQIGELEKVNEILIEEKREQGERLLSYQSELSELQEKLNQFEKQVSEFKQLLAVKEQNIEGLQQQIQTNKKDLQNKVNSGEKERKDMQEQINVTEAKLKKAEGQLQVALGEKEELEGQLEELERRITQRKNDQEKLYEKYTLLEIKNKNDNEEYGLMLEKLAESFNKEQEKNIETIYSASERIYQDLCLMWKAIIGYDPEVTDDLSVSYRSANNRLSWDEFGAVEDSSRKNSPCTFNDVNALCEKNIKLLSDICEKSNLMSPDGGDVLSRDPSSFYQLTYLSYTDLQGVGNPRQEVGKVGFQGLIPSQTSTPSRSPYNQLKRDDILNVSCETIRQDEYEREIQKKDQELQEKEESINELKGEISQLKERLKSTINTLDTKCTQLTESTEEMEQLEGYFKKAKNDLQHEKNQRGWSELGILDKHNEELSAINNDIQGLMNKLGLQDSSETYSIKQVECFSDIVERIRSAIHKLNSELNQHMMRNGISASLLSLNSELDAAVVVEKLENPQHYTTRTSKETDSGCSTEDDGSQYGSREGLDKNDNPLTNNYGVKLFPCLDRKTSCPGF